MPDTTRSNNGRRYTQKEQALFEALRHANGREHGHDPLGCSGCAGVERLDCEAFLTQDGRYEVRRSELSLELSIRRGK